MMAPMPAGQRAGEAAYGHSPGVVKPRLLIFSPYFPPHVGGLEGYVSDLDEVLLDRGLVDGITVLTPWLPREGPRAEQPAPGYSVLRYPARELIPNFPVPALWSRGFWRALRRARPRDHDVFVSHTRFFLSSALALACARACRRPLLHVEHGSDFVQLSARPARLAARVYDLSLGRLVLRCADGVIAVSQAAADFVRSLAGRDDAVVIRRGLRRDLLDAAGADDGVLSWAAGRQVVAFVGRLIDGKGVADLLRAFAAVGRERAVLCIVGDGPRRGDLEALAAQLGLGDSARFLGYLPEQRAWGVIRSADIVVNPSYTEGLPTSVLEAALLGKAIVASEVGGTGEIVQAPDSAILYEPRDIDALSEGLDRLLGDGDMRERLGVAARTLASGRFDREGGAIRFAEVAAALAGSRGRSPQPPATSAVSSTSAKTDS